MFRTFNLEKGMLATMMCFLFNLRERMEAEFQAHVSQKLRRYLFPLGKPSPCRRVRGHPEAALPQSRRILGFSEGSGGVCNNQMLFSLWQGAIVRGFLLCWPWRRSDVLLRLSTSTCVS